jgi:hypothetical protein
LVRVQQRDYKGDGLSVGNEAVLAWSQTDVQGEIVCLTIRWYKYRFSLISGQREDCQT